MSYTIDLPRFWAENRASAGKAFRTDKPRAPVGLPVDDHWLLEEMRAPSTVRYYREADYRAQLNRAGNDRCEQALGLRPFRQTPEPKPILRIEHVMGARTELTEGGTPWLEPGVHNVDELHAKLDDLGQLDDTQLRARMFSTGGVVEKAAPSTTVSPWSRGPATIATSVIGTTEVLFWVMDYPGEMHRFFDRLADLLIRYHRIVACEAGLAYRGFCWLDDNCALFSPALYEEFCLPVMERVFAAFAPAPGDYRFQHSDSDMAHLLPLLSRLNFSAVNFGPNIPAALIREHMPRTEIHGQVAPFTLRNQPPEAVIAEVRRDFDAVGADGGLLVTTAGSIAAGTSLEAIRCLMWAVQEYCRYDR